MKAVIRNTISGLAIVLLIAACATQKGKVQINSEEDETAVVPADSVEYDIETFDSKFETWYALQNSPAKYRSEVFYESWNEQYVSAWNNKALGPNSNSFFETIVGWDPTIDYDFEVDHELFYYFQYVENVLKIQILPNGPKSVVF